MHVVRAIFNPYFCRFVLVFFCPTKFFYVPLKSNERTLFQILKKKNGPSHVTKRRRKPPPLFTSLRVTTNNGEETLRRGEEEEEKGEGKGGRGG